MRLQADSFARGHRLSDPRPGVEPWKWNIVAC